jgi:hypothetical protein
LLVVALALGACAGLPGHDAPQVTVVSVEPLDGEGLEFRTMVKLRVVNPNDQPIDYDGVYVKLDVQGHTVATGVSNEKGSVPRFGESVIAIPVSFSIVDVALKGLQMFQQGTAPESLQYRLEGKLNGPMFGATRFQSEGSLNLRPPQQ